MAHVTRKNRIHCFTVEDVIKNRGEQPDERICFLTFSSSYIPLGLWPVSSIFKVHWFNFCFPLPWPQYIKEQRDYIENEIRENLAKLHNLYSAQSALKSKEAEIEYCENGHGRVKDNWDGGDKCPVCGASFIGSCKLGLVDRDY